MRSKMGVPDKKSVATRRMVHNVKETGFMEKKDLKKPFIGYPLLARKVLG
jgi:hypothetical protein